MDIETPSKESIADWLVRTRVAKGWNQVDVARASGITQAQISNIEAGKTRNPRALTLKKLREALADSAASMGSSKAPDGASMVPTPEVDRESKSGAELSSAITDAKKEAEIVGVGVLTDFDPYDENDLPDEPGVYVFYDITDRPVYVGSSARRSIAIRVKEHEEKFWFRRPVVDYGAYVAISDEQLCRQVESILIKFLKSNALLNKQQVDRG